MRKKKIIILVLASILVIGIGIGTYILIKKRKQARFKDEANLLIELAKKEGDLSEGEIERVRFLFGIQNYSLPKEYSQYFTLYKKEIESAKKYLDDKNYLAFKNEVVKVLNKIPLPERNSFLKGIGLVYDVIRRIHDLSLNSNGLMVNIASKVKPVSNFIADNPYVMGLSALIMPYDRVNKYISGIDAIKNNPQFIVMKELYSSNSNYTKEELKIFDLIWRIYSGQNFFNINLEI